MGTVQQRFEIGQPASAVYEALSAPDDILQKMPGVTGVTSLSPDLYRVIFGAAESPRQVDLQLTRHPELRRVEWQTVDGGWTGAVTAEPIGPARSAVGVHAESVQPDVESPPPSLIHDALHAFKRVLQSREIHVSHGMSGARATSARHASADSCGFASEWRNVARSAFSRPAEYPFALMRTVSRQVDRLWGDIWRGTPIAKLPHIVPGLHWNPDVEVCEQDDQVRICVDVPGVDQSNLQVEVDEGCLTIRGDRQDERATDPGHRRTEVHYGAFTRRIPLPEGIDPDTARAVLRNGVLEVRIALHRREPRKVPVQHAS